MAAPLTCRFLKKLRCSLNFRQTLVRFAGSSASPSAEELFQSSHVQQLLRRVTGFDVTKILAPRKEARDRPQYKLMTDEELKESQEVAETKARRKLQMPPVMNERQPIDAVFSEDTEIEGFCTEGCNYVFTDITYGVSDRARTIVVREPSGRLRQASWEERDRMNKIYNTKPHQKFYTPSAFEETNLEEQLSRGQYLTVLDRACVQFEPDDPLYIRAAEATYEHVNAHHNHEVLYSTRHFGPFVLYLVTRRTLDSLLAHTLHVGRLPEAGDLVRLYHAAHPSCGSAVKAGGQDWSAHQLVESYVSEDSTDPGPVGLALQALLDAQPQQEAAAAS